MKYLFFITVFSLIGFSSFARAEVKDLGPIMKKASATESLSNLLEQISLAPAKDPKTGKNVFKVTKIKKGSVYEREGIKVGDLVTQ